MQHCHRGINPVFNDPYFSPGQGWSESTHVFFRGNLLPERLASWSSGVFSVGELGFGTGLNMWTLLSHYQTLTGEKLLPAPSCVHEGNPEKILKLYSVDAHPLDIHELSCLLNPYVEDLGGQEVLDLYLGSYSRIMNGKDRVGSDRFFLGSTEVLIQVWKSDVMELLNDLIFREVTCDAWFLDGHDPAKNPEMWSSELMAMVARCTVPGGTLATFTAAGTVKQALRNAGFSLVRRKGFGNKRHMIQGTLEASIPG